jgi:hypothetical protein
MQLLKRKQKLSEHVDKPAIVTGNFELHYEEVVKRNRYAIIALIAGGLLALGAFIPSAVYHSVANEERVIVEVESGKINNPALITEVHGDVSAGESGYIEFGERFCREGESPQKDNCVARPTNP